MKKAISILKIVGNVVLWLFVVFAIFVTILVFSAQANKDGLPNIMGKSLVTVQSDSMKPEFKKGDLIICEVLTDSQKKDLQVGDVVTYYCDIDGDGEKNEFNTHRIVDKYDDGTGYTYFVTRGDNHEMSTANDAPITSALIVAKYSDSKILFVGSFINFLQTSTGFLIVIVLPLVLFFLFELYNFISAIISMKVKKAAATDEEEIKRRAVEEYLRRQEAANAAQSGQADSNGSAENNVSAAVPENDNKE